VGSFQSGGFDADLTLYEPCQKTGATPCNANLTVGGEEWSYTATARRAPK